MFSEIDNPQGTHSLANEASLVAMLGMADSAGPAGSDETFEVAPEVDPEMAMEMALEVLLSDPSLGQLLLRRQQDGVETITAYYRLPVLVGQQRVSWHVPFVPRYRLYRRAVPIRSIAPMCGFGLLTCKSLVHGPK